MAMASAVSMPLLLLCAPHPRSRSASMLVWTMPSTCSIKWAQEMHINLNKYPALQMWSFKGVTCQDIFEKLVSVVESSFSELSLLNVVMRGLHFHVSGLHGKCQLLWRNNYSYLCIWCPTGRKQAEKITMFAEQAAGELIVAYPHV